MSTRYSLLVLVSWLITTSTALAQPEAKSTSAPSLTDSFGDPLAAGAVARLGTTRFRHGGWTSGLAISPDSKTLVTTGENGTIRFWDIASGKLLHEFKEEKRRFRGSLYSPDGKWLVTKAVAADFHSKQPAELIFWNTRTRKAERSFPLNRYSPGRFLFTPDSKFLIGGAQGQVFVLEAETGKELLRYRLAARPLHALALSPDGRVVAASEEYSGEVKLWQWESVEEPRILKSGRDRGFNTLAFSPDGKLLFGRGRDTGDDGIAIWDVQTGRLVKEWIGHRSLDYADNFAIHPAGKLVAVVQAGNRAGDDGPGLFFWNLQTGKLVRRLPTAGQPVFSPDRRWLAVATSGGARVWDLKSFEEVAVHEATHHREVWRMELSSKGILATASEDGTIGLWDPQGKFQRKLVLPERAYDLAFSAAGNLLLVARSEWIDLWDIPSGKKRYTLPGHAPLGRVLRPIAFSSDGTEFCSFGGNDYFFRRYRTANGKTLVEKRLIPAGMDEKKIFGGLDDLGGPEKYMLTIAGAKFTRDGKTLVLAERQRIHLFDTANGAQVRHFDTEDIVDSYDFALSPDGKWLFAASREPSKAKDTQQSKPKRFATIWDLATGKVLRRTPLAEEYAGAMAFSPDGKYYALVGRDYPRGQRIRIWESANGKEVCVMENLPENVRALAFSLDNRRLYTSLADTTVVIWELPGPKSP